jgi:hypothetical protein
MKDTDFLRIYEQPLSLSDARAAIQAVNRYDFFHARKMAIDAYGFAIPCKEAITALAGLSPLVEVGAGNGYYSRLLRAAGADVVATDAGMQSGYSKVWKTDGIIQMTAIQAVKAYPDRNVFVSWPSYDEDWATKMALAMKKGRVLGYIGEGRGGCTANRKFFDILASHFETVEELAIPKWDGIHDGLTIAKKKKRRSL